jgi:hypothetical protein
MKVHLAHFHYPLIEGREIGAACGRRIPNAKFVHIFDDVKVGSDDWMADLYSVNCCRKCYFAAVDGFQNRYIYGIVSGEDAKQAERGVSA